MPAPRITMRKIRDVLRLRLSGGLSIREIKASTKLSVGGIQKLLAKAKALGLTWPLPDDLDDNRLAQLFYPTADTGSSTQLQMPDWAEIHQELKHRHMTKQLLWEDYTQQYPNRCYSYSQFCERYRRWCKTQKRSMRQHHKAGETYFVDYAGATVPIVNPDSGAIREAQVFIGALGASNYTYAEATWSQSLPDWLGSHGRMLEYFGGCTALIVPDNLRSSVSKACRYDPDLNPSYQQWAQYQAHCYSVPHQYVGERLELHASETLVEAYFRRQRVATHARQYTPGFTTNAAHMPERHRAQQQWSPGRLKRWAADIGPDTLSWVSAQLERREHPEQTYRVCLGLFGRPDTAFDRVVVDADVTISRLGISQCRPLVIVKLERLGLFFDRIQLADGEQQRPSRGFPGLGRIRHFAPTVRHAAEVGHASTRFGQRRIVG